MLKCLDPNIAAKIPSQLFPKPGGPISIKEMTVEREHAKMTVVINGPLEFLGGKITVNDLEVTVEWTKGEDLKFTGSSTIMVGPLAVGLKLEKQANSYVLSAYVESFKLNQLEELVGPTTLTQFMSLLGSLDGFGIKDFKLIKNFGEGSDSALRYDPLKLTILPTFLYVTILLAILTHFALSTGYLESQFFGAGRKYPLKDLFGSQKKRVMINNQIRLLQLELLLRT